MKITLFFELLFLPAVISIAGALAVHGAPAAHRAAAQDESDAAAELITRFRSLPDRAVAEGIALLDAIDATGSEGAVRFVVRVMERHASSALRGHAFFLWARGRTEETVIEFLDGRKTSRFGDYVAVIPRLHAFDRLGYLQSLYEDETLTAFRLQIFAALAALDSEESFAFLETKWSEVSNRSQSQRMLDLLLTMSRSRSTGFLDRLLGSDFPRARLVAVERMLSESAALALRVEVFLRTETDPRVRSGALRALGALGDAEGARAILKSADWHSSYRLFEIVETLCAMPVDAVRAALPEDWYADRNARLFQVGCLVLANFGVSDAMRQIKSAERKATPASRIVAAVARGRLEKNRGRIERLMGAGDGEARYEVLDAIERYRLGDDAVKKKLLALAASPKSGDLQIKAVQVLAALGDGAALGTLEKCLAAKRLAVRVAAARALRSIRDGRSVGLLVARLGKETGRAAWEIQRSLRELTGRDFGIDSAQWTAWWDKASDGFEALPDPEGPDAPWKVESEPDSHYSFYGVTIDSHNIVFAIDVSGSMAGPRFLRDEERPISRLVAELSRTISSLTPQHFVNLVFFETTVRRWRKTLMPMDEGGGSYKAEALTYVRYLSPSGDTNLHGALMTAMSDEEADAIVLLSDGEPTVGPLTDTDEILEAVLKRNRVLQATIHTIAIGKADRTFLKRLALATGGTFKTR